MLVRSIGLAEAMLMWDVVGVSLFASYVLVLIGVRRPGLPSTGEPEPASEALSLPEGLLLRNAPSIRDDFERLWLGVLLSIALDHLILHSKTTEEREARRAKSEQIRYLGSSNDIRVSSPRCRHYCTTARLANVKLCCSLERHGRRAVAAR